MKKKCPGSTLYLTELPALQELWFILSVGFMLGSYMWITVEFLYLISGSFEGISLFTERQPVEDVSRVR
jgi:hypothetical protein